MGTKEKLIERFKSLPANFTFEEMERLLSIFGYEKSNKGKTSGLRVIFKNDSQTSSRQPYQRVCNETSIK